MSKATGQVKIRVNGQAYKSKRGATLRPSGVTRNEIPRDYGVDYSEEFTGPRIEATFVHGPGFDLQAFDILDATVLFETDTGQIYQIINARRIEEPPTLTAGEGEVPVRIGGDKSVRVA